MAGCKHFSEYMALQQKALRLALDENKWYLSERAGYDVGMAVALDDFCRHHLDRFAHEFRITFCGRLCPAADTCIGARSLRCWGEIRPDNPGAEG